MAIVITGTGTGPFTVTGSGVTDPVTSATIYAYVIAQSAANASRVGTTIFSYSWACKINLSSCFWNPVQEAHIFAQMPSILANAEFRNGSLISGVAKNGGMIQMPTTGGLLTGGGKFASYGGIVAAPSSAPGSSNGPVVLRDTICQWGDSITNTGTNDYFRVTIGSSGAVGFKVTVVPIRFQDVKFAGCTIAFQQNTTATFTPVDTILEGVTYDIVDNLVANTLILQGLYSDFGVPKNTLIITGERAGGVKIIQWRYNLAVSTAAGPLGGAAVTIRDVLGVVNYAGATVAGVIPQQTLERVRYTGLVNRAYLTNWAGAITEKYPHTVRVRNFGFLPVEVVKQADQHGADGVILAVDAGATGTEAQAAAITGVSVNAGTETVTVSAALTVPQIYNAISYYLALTANHGVPWFASCNGATISTDTWDWVLSAPVTGTLASSAGVITSLAANVSAVELTGTARWDTEAPCVAQGGSAAAGTTVRITTATSDAVADFQAFDFDAASTFENTSGQPITLLLSLGQTAPVLLPTNGTITIANPIYSASATVLPDTRVQLFNVTTGLELDNVFVAGAAYTVALPTGATPGDTLRLRACKKGYEGAEAFAVWSSTGAVFLLNQVTDSAYAAWGIDGATVTEFALDGTNLQIDANDVDGETQKVRLGAFFSFALTTELGIRSFYGAVTFLSAAQIRVNVDKVDMQIDNTNAAQALRFTDLSVRLFRSDGTSVIAPTSKTIHNDYNGVPDVVGGIPTASENALAVWNQTLPVP